MPRRALRPSFVVTFALGAVAAIPCGCSTKESGGGNIVDGSIDDGGCPADLPTSGEPCNAPPSLSCSYAQCQPGCPVSPRVSAACYEGGWLTFACNPPNTVYCQPEDDAGPDANDAAPGAPSGGPDGEGQDGSHVADAAGDVAPDAESE
jgi:hypothetical protein